MCVCLFVCSCVVCRVSVCHFVPVGIGMFLLLDVSISAKSTCLSCHIFARDVACSVPEVIDCDWVRLAFTCIGFLYEFLRVLITMLSVRYQFRGANK